jgi:fermentation-respiration switch protein FrsA (DUF1100 family)
VTRIVIITLVTLLLLKLAVSRLEPKMVFFPTRGQDETPARLGIRYHALTLKAADGTDISAWQLEPDDPKANILYFHGNGGNLSLWMPVLATLHRFGYRVLAIDYRGYGLSGGRASEKGLTLDAVAAAQHAARTRTPGQPLVYWGRSLGGPVAAAAAKAEPPDAIVLENTFPNKVAVVRWHPVFRLLNLFSSYRFDTVAAMRGFDRPVLVVHGVADTIIPYTLGQELFKQLDAPKRFVSVPGADHNDFFDARNQAYWQPVRAFLDGL